MRKGWRRESERHSLAAKGISTKEIKHSNLSNPDLFHALQRIEYKREELSDASQEYENAITLLFEIEDFTGFVDPNGQDFEDLLVMHKYTVQELFNMFYNIKYPPRKGEKIWDNNYKTWIHITKNVDEYYYDGYIFDEKGIKRNVDSTYYHVERQKNW